MLVQALIFSLIMWLLGASRPQAIIAFVLFLVFAGLEGAQELLDSALPAGSFQNPLISTPGSTNLLIY